jgi:hypothetical protein
MERAYRFFGCLAGILIIGLACGDSRHSCSSPPVREQADFTPVVGAVMGLGAAARSGRSSIVWSSMSRACRASARAVRRA